MLDLVVSFPITATGLPIGSATAAVDSLQISTLLDLFVDPADNFGLVSKGPIKSPVAVSAFAGIQRFASAGTSGAGDSSGSEVGGISGSGSGNDNGGVGRVTQFPLHDLNVLTDADRRRISESVVQFYDIISEDGHSPFYVIANMSHGRLKPVVEAIATKWFRMYSDEKKLHQKDWSHFDVMPIRWFYDELTSALSEFSRYLSIIWCNDVEYILIGISVESRDQALQLLFEDWAQRPGGRSVGEHDTIPNPQWAIKRLSEILNRVLITEEPEE